MPTWTKQQLAEYEHRSKSPRFDSKGVRPGEYPAILGNSKSKRIRQSEAPLMNKAESQFHAMLVRMFPASFIYIQAITFKIANGVRYTPDFVMFSPLSGIVDAFEVKGFMREDAAVKLKVAAGKFPNIKWTLVSGKSGEWITQMILP